MTPLQLALDWTPNINHIGFFVAQAQGFYAEMDIAIQITDPSADNYQLTPAKKVEMGHADFALCPTESLVSYQTKKTPFPLKAIAAVLQEDLSAVVVRKDSSIHSPKALDGRSYASYQARYEDGIVKEMIRKDGGKGELNIIYPEKLGIWNTVLSGEYDATWVFMNWEGVQVESLGKELRSFRLADYGIPYSYSPMVACNGALIQENHALYSRFISACGRGFQFAQEHPIEAIRILESLVPEHEQNIDLEKALSCTAPYFTHEGSWGMIELERVRSFLDWLYEHELESHQLNVEDIISPLDPRS